MNVGAVVKLMLFGVLSNYLRSFFDGFRHPAKRYGKVWYLGNPTLVSKLYQG
jgi:hypothetical protein